jgi:hypothetical protein
MLDLKLLEVPLGRARAFSRQVQRETRGALVRLKARERALLRLAAIHEEVLVPLERADTRFERRVFRGELLDQLTARIVHVSEEDATERGRDEDVVFLWDDGHVRLDWKDERLWINEGRLCVDGAKYRWEMVRGMWGMWLRKGCRWNCERMFLCKDRKRGGLV